MEWFKSLSASDGQSMKWSCRRYANPDLLKFTVKYHIKDASPNLSARRQNRSIVSNDGFFSAEILILLISCLHHSSWNMFRPSSLLGCDNRGIFIKRSLCQRFPKFKLFTDLASSVMGKIWDGLHGMRSCQHQSHKASLSARQVRVMSPASTPSPTTRSESESRQALEDKAFSVIWWPDPGNLSEFSISSEVLHSARIQMAVHYILLSSWNRRPSSS